MNLLYILLIAILSVVADTVYALPGDASSGLQFKPRIVGGTFGDTSEFPGVAALIQYDSSSGSYASGCGGNLIAPQWVVTAAHCVDTPPNYVGFGKNTVTSYDISNIVPIEKIVVHPAYSADTFENDIALIKLKDFSSKNYSPLVGSYLTEVLTEYNLGTVVVGYGLTEESANSRDFRFRKATVKLFDRNECASDLKLPSLPESMICAGERSGGVDACYGDSGGPLFFILGDVKVQVGIVSWGDGCARPNLPGVYTNISMFRQWINSVKNSG